MSSTSYLSLSDFTPIVPVAGESARGDGAHRQRFYRTHEGVVYGSKTEAQDVVGRVRALGWSGKVLVIRGGGRYEATGWVSTRMAPAPNAGARRAMVLARSTGGDIWIDVHAVIAVTEAA